MNPARAVAALSSLLALLVGAPAAAQQPTQPAAFAVEHGKLATGDATPVGAGVLELEVGLAPSWVRGSGPLLDSAYEHALSLSATYGIGEHLDLRLASGAARVGVPGETGPASSYGSGLADSAVGARWRFLASAERALDLAVVGELVIPTGRRASADEPGLSQEHWSGAAALVASKDWGRSTGNLELGGDLPVAGDAAGRRVGWFANAAMGRQILSWLQPEVELNYEGGHEGAISHRVALTAGALLPLAGGQRLALGVTRDLWSRNAEETTSAAVALKLAL